MGNAPSVGGNCTTIYQYDQSNWVARDGEKSSTKKNSLRVVTLNQWFGSFELASRIQAQIEEFKRLDPDIICLQESEYQENSF